MFKRASLFAATLLLGTPALASGDWSGWYVGGQLGHANGSSRADTTLGGQWAAESQALRDYVTAEMSGDVDPTGTSHGVYFGYNHQFPGGFVLGGEVAYTQNNADESINSGPTPTAPQKPAPDSEVRSTSQAPPTPSTADSGTARATSSTVLPRSSPTRGRRIRAID